MDAVTYPKKDVHDFINQRLVPVRVPFDSKPLAKDFNVKWTPTLITLDTEGHEHHRTLGFLSAEELIPSLTLGLAKVEYEGERFEQALELFEAVVKDHPESNSTPEALYLMGVSRFKQTHEASHLKDAFETLRRKYPGSDWAKRAEPYGLL